MRVIVIIEDDIVIRKIIIHLCQWNTRNHDPHSLGSQDIHDFIID